MAIFKKNITTSGTFKNISVCDGLFIDVETGEEIEVSKILEEVYGSGQAFELSVKQKTENEITPEDE